MREKITSKRPFAAGGKLYVSTACRPRIPITVVMPTLNEAARISAAIKALQWADEVIVADGGSTDDTAELARQAGALVLDSHGGSIASQRNAGIRAARNEWILTLDADERVPDDLRDEIAALVIAPKHRAYRIRFRNFYLGREMRHGRWGNESHVRLFRSSLRFLERRVHEHLEPVSNVGILRARIEHSPYRNLAHHIEKIARYSLWNAEDLALRGQRTNFAQLTIHPIWRFFREYFIYSGWRDGRAGLVVALLSASSAVMKYAHLQELEWQTAAQTAPTAEDLPLPFDPGEAPPESWAITSDS